jgi:hypothetical protein
MPSGANAFEISDIQEERNREPVLAKRSECSNVMLHCIDKLPLYQFAREDALGAGLFRRISFDVWEFIPIGHYELQEFSLVINQVGQSR